MINYSLYSISISEILCRVNISIKKVKSLKPCFHKRLINISSTFVFPLNIINHSGVLRYIPFNFSKAVGLNININHFWREIGNFSLPRLPGAQFVVRNKDSENVS